MSCQLIGYDPLLALIIIEKMSLDSAAPCGATLSNKIHGFFSVCHAPVDLLKKGT